MNPDEAELLHRLMGPEDMDEGWMVYRLDWMVADLIEEFEKGAAN